VQNFVKPYVEKAFCSTTSDETQKPNFLASMAEQTQDPELLNGVLLNTVLAGRNTTASLLINLFFVLSRDQYILQKLRAEISTANLDGPPTLTDFKAPPLPEILHQRVAPPPRSYPTKFEDSGPRHGSPARRRDHGQSPIFVAAGTQVGSNIFSTQRLSSIWGDDANSFVPER